MTKHFMRALLGVAMLAVWVGITVVPASAGDIYVQPPNLSSGGSWASQNDTNGGGNFATVYDDFTLGSTSSIGMVTWAGAFWNGGNHGTITGFTVDFWADSSGAPGALQWGTGDVAGNANETLLGYDQNSWPIYSYTLSLSTPFVASAGTQYWLSIVADLGFPPQWAWETGTGGDGVMYQDWYGTLYENSTDMAFSLGTTATPEPGSILLMATFLMALGPIIRKKLF